jgi:hypothetical protein
VNSARSLLMSFARVPGTQPGPAHAFILPSPAERESYQSFILLLAGWTG